MYLERIVFQAKPGKVNQLVEIFKKLRDAIPEFNTNLHYFTDVTGNNWTFVMQRDIKELNDLVTSGASPDVADTVAKLMGEYHDLVDSATREIYRYVD